MITMINNYVYCVPASMGDKHSQCNSVHCTFSSLTCYSHAIGMLCGSDVPSVRQVDPVSSRSSVEVKSVEQCCGKFSYR